MLVDLLATLPIACHIFPYPEVRRRYPNSFAVRLQQIPSVRPKMDADAHGPLRLRQVQLPSHHASLQTNSTDSLVNISRKEQEDFHSALVRLMPAKYWPKGSYKQSSSRPIVVTTEHQK